MSQKRAQLFGNVVTDAVFAGVVTATSVNVAGSSEINSSGINVTGVITATTFSGDGSGLTGVGVGTEDNINTTGIITASTISANEFIGSGDKLIFSPSPTQFNPISGATDVGLSTTITITFDQPIYAGVGSIFLRNSSGIGTEIEAIGIGSTLISGQTLSFTPSSLPVNTNVYVVLPQGVITNSIGGNNSLLDTYNFTSVDFFVSSFSPTDGSTDVGIGTTVVLTFNIPPTRGTGTIELKSGDPLTGTLIESFDAAASGRISVSGNEWRLDPTSDLNYSTTVYPIIPNGAIANYSGINTVGAAVTYSFTTGALPLGSFYEGGYFICASGGTRWVVAPCTAEVGAEWDSRANANSCAQSVSGCTGWFVPTCGQLQNPGFVCRIYWDYYSSSQYWSNSPGTTPTSAWYIDFNSGSAVSRSKYTARCVRAFRCVTY